MDKDTFGHRFSELLMEAEDPEEFRFALGTIDSIIPVIRNQIEQRFDCCLE